jgi:hypothetical protein
VIETVLCERISQETPSISRNPVHDGARLVGREEYSESVRGKLQTRQIKLNLVRPCGLGHASQSGRKGEAELSRMVFVQVGPV